jgi:hypothetical protein
MAAHDDSPVRRRVRVYFGRHVIAKYSADPKLANEYAKLIRQRFGGLEITIDDELSGDERPMPAERLWDAVAP